MKEMKTRGDSRSFTFAILLCILLLISCGGDTTSDNRAERASGARGDILVGIIEKSDATGAFRKGIELAIKEINQTGGLLGRNLGALYYSDQNGIDAGKRSARALAKKLDVIAVIGRLDPDAAVAASVILEKAGLLFILNGTTQSASIQFDRLYTFTNAPDAEVVGDLLVQTARNAGISKAVAFFERTSDVRRYKDIFHTRATRYGIEMIATRSFFSYEHEFQSLDWNFDFKDVIWKLKKGSQFDGVFIMGDYRPSAVLIRQLRELNVDARILGGGGLDDSLLPKEAGEAAEGVIIAAAFNPGNPDKNIRRFVEGFTTEFGSTPDKWAAQGYDSVRMLSTAIRQSGSTRPDKIAHSLRFLKNWPGVSGQLSLTPGGHIVNKTIFLKTIVDGKFIYLDPGETKTREGDARS